MIFQIAGSGTDFNTKHYGFGSKTLPAPRLSCPGRVAVAPYDGCSAGSEIKTYFSSSLNHYPVPSHVGYVTYVVHRKDQNPNCLSMMYANNLIYHNVPVLRNGIQYNRGNPYPNN
jgi:hypothetical protein